MLDAFRWGSRCFGVPKVRASSGQVLAGVRVDAIVCRIGAFELSGNVDLINAVHDRDNLLDTDLLRL